MFISDATLWTRKFTPDRMACFETPGFGDLDSGNLRFLPKNEYM